MLCALTWLFSMAEIVPTVNITWIQATVLSRDKWGTLVQLICQLSSHIAITTSWAEIWCEKATVSSCLPLGELHWSLPALTFFAVSKLAFTGSDMKHGFHAKIKSIFTCILIIMSLFNYRLTGVLIYYALLRTEFRCSSILWLQSKKYYSGSSRVSAAWLCPEGRQHKSWTDWVKSGGTVIEKLSPHLDNDSGSSAAN